MHVRSYLLTAFSALILVLAVAATSGISFADDSLHNDTYSQTLELPTADDASLNQCSLPNESPEAASQTADYECPEGVPYCQQDSQCAGYCGGPVSFDLCYHGCCTCAG